MIEPFRVFALSSNEFKLLPVGVFLFDFKFFAVVDVIFLFFSLEIVRRRS